MYKSVLDYLCCPKCRADLSLQIEIETQGDVTEGLLLCPCGHSFQIQQGVANFGSDEQEFANQWQSLSEEEHFEKVDLDIDQKSPTEILERRKLVLDAIASAVSDRKLVLDIASGRGLLLAELAKQLDEDAHILSIDLSSYVLRYDRHKFNKIAPNRKISYLACDATNLPFKDSVIDSATTYCGFSNMLGCAEDALKESHRVLKNGAVLVDSYVVVEPNSEGHKLLQKICNEQNLIDADQFFLHESIMVQHKNLFRSVDCNTIFEGLGVGNGMDLLPYHGEWYAEQVFVSKK